MRVINHKAISAAAIFSLSTGTFYAQEFFREFGTSRTSGGIGRLSPNAEVFVGNNGDILPEAPFSSEINEDDYNMRLGNLDFVVALGFGIEFNDNITLANRNEISDIIFRPQLDIEGILRFSESNQIRLGVGIGYAKYLDHDEFDTDGLLISPTSAFLWNVEVGAFKFTLRERLSYQEDPFDLPTLSNTATYRRWENQAGLQVDWDASQYTKITVGYDRYDLRSTEETFESFDRGIDTLYIRPGFQVAPAVTVGLNLSHSWVKYRQNVQSDARVLLVGPYIDWKVSDYVDVYVEAGYQSSDFEGGTIQPSGVDTDDGSSVYAKLALTHRPSENFRHKLEVSKTTELGFGSNFFDLYHLEYTVDWKIAENTSLSPSLFYEWYESSGDFGEDGSRFGAAVGIHHIFSEHLTIGLDYRFLIKDSNLPDADYTQNLGLLSLYYKF